MKAQATEAAGAPGAGAPCPGPAVHGPLAGLLGAVQRVVRALLVTVFAFMLAATFANVFARYVLSTAFPWVDEASSMGIVWLSFLAILAGVHEDMHPAFDVLRARAGPLGRKVLGTATNLAILVFLGFATVGGVRYAVRASVQKTAILGISYSWMYAAVPITAALMALEIGAKIAGIWLAPGPSASKPRDTAGAGADK